MKHTYQYILSSLFLLAPALAQAQDPGVVLRKSVSDQNADGSFTIRLETFATGGTEVTMTDMPADIVLVLDVSTSMTRLRGNSTVSNQSLSYNDVANGTKDFFIEYGGNWVQIFPDIDNQNRRRLYIYPNGAGKRYLTKDRNGNYNGDTQGNNYATSNADGGVILSFTDNKLRTGSSRLSDLQTAVKDFINEINRNDQKNIVNGVGNRIGHRIALVTFARNATVQQSLIYLNEANVASLLNTVDNFEVSDQTYGYKGIDEANTQFRTVTRTDQASRTVVFFTDGEQNSSGGWDDVIDSSFDSKSLYSASVYTVGMFSQVHDASIDEGLSVASSNYPEAKSLSNRGSKTDTKYYQDASDPNHSLSSIFLTIASDIKAKADNEDVEAHSQVRDVLTSSFTLPSNFNALNDVIVYTVEPKPNKNSEVLEWYEVPDRSAVNYPNDADGHVVKLTTVTSGTDYLTDPTKVKVSTGTDSEGRKTLWVEGFDYTADDSSIGAGNGNWVGRRYNGDYFWAGKKLVIEFNIVSITSATGGDDTQTNTSDSGLYIWDPDTEEYTALVKYEIPHADVPINIVIEKEGMKHGESATVQIYRARQLVIDEEIQYDERTGKPLPDLRKGADGKYIEGAGWQNFSKVILTNKGADRATVTETLLCLDSHYVYLLEEDNWGWSYNLDTKRVHTSEKVSNPFTFTNTDKSGVVKHAEAAAFNYFGEDHEGSRVVKVKSKEKLNTPVTGGNN